MTEDCPDDSDDIYEDLDALFSPKATTICQSSDDAISCISGQTETSTDVWMDDKDLLVFSNQTKTLSSRREAESKKLEMDLLVEFVIEEGTSRKSILKMDPEFQELKNEVLRLKALNAEKDTLISELTGQNINLKKNICSLYKTAKSEVEHKDTLLKEVNYRLDSFYLKKRNLYRMKDQCSQTVDQRSDTPETNVSRKKFKDVGNQTESDFKDQNIPETRKRALSPDQEKANKHAKQSRIEKCDSLSQMTLCSTDCQMKTAEQSPDSNSEEFNGAKDTTETNDMSFNLLPKHVKHTLFEFQQSQIMSLNRLKQSFVNHYYMQAKKQTHDGQAPSESDGKSSDSPIPKSCDINASDSSVNHINDVNSSDSSMNQVSDVNASDSSVNQVSDVNAADSSVNQLSDINVSKELPSLSSVNHQAHMHNGYPGNVGTDNFVEHSKSLSNDKTTGRCNSRASFKAGNFPGAFKCVAINVYRKRQIQRQIAENCRQMKNKCT